MSTWEVIQGDCLDVLRSMPDASVDAVVTDPPYGLSFMGKKWDYDVPDVEVWSQCLRVLKPGGHLLAFAGTRTQHRMAVRIEGAGFEIRDMVMNAIATDPIVGSFLASLNDEQQRAFARVFAESSFGGLLAWVYGSGFPKSHNLKDEWYGWGTALKPALEPITMARKPFPGTVAANVLEHGTGAINVNGCRVGTEAIQINTYAGRGPFGESQVGNGYDQKHAIGRWPANLVHDGSDEVVRVFPSDGDKSPARFFYCAKASKADRGDDNNHPTVKPTDLMRYLCRLVTPPGGTVLDPFTGSGSTGRGAILEGFNFIGIEREAEYVEIARRRIADAANHLYAGGAK